jgi:hypothetical protein
LENHGEKNKKWPFWERKEEKERKRGEKGIIKKGRRKK